MSRQQHTPGPWYWHASMETKQISLLTPDRGRLTVMAFDRWGMQGAAPSFCDDESVMEPAHKLVAPDHNGVATEIDHPDARLIAAAPDLLEALVELLNACPSAVSARAVGGALDAVAKARGES